MAEKPKILVVEDDEDIQELVRYNLERAGFSVDGVGDGDEALKAARAGRPDLIVLDLMLPKLDGMEVARALKSDAKTSGIVIIMLTAKGSEADIVAGLEAGADDYVTKPFSPKVLVARVKAALRRGARDVAGGKGEQLKVKDITIDIRKRAVSFKGFPIELTATEFALLVFLARRPGWVFTRRQLIDSLKGSDYPVTERSVDVQVVGLRKKLGPAGKNVETVRGVGYRFKE